MTAEYTGKIALVTGGASGIGAAVWRLLIARGASVASVDRDEERVAALARELETEAEGRVLFVPADVGTAAGAEHAVAAAVLAFGGLDWVHNNAGIQRYGTADATSEALWDEVLTVNLKSMFLVTKAAIPHLRRRGGGAFVNTGSVQSLGAVPNSLAYVTSKHGVLGLTRSVALDYGAEGIRANCVCPGAVDTPMLRWAAGLPGGDAETRLAEWNRMHPIGRVGRAEEIAEAVCFLLSDRASFITGAAFTVDGGLLVPIGGHRG